MSNSANNPNATIQVTPAQYFRDHLDGNGAPMNGMEVSVRLPQPHQDWVGYAMTDFPGNTRSQMDILSLAIDFGATRPPSAWGYPVWTFSDIHREILVREMNGDSLRNWGPGRMDTSETLKLVTDPKKLRMAQNTIDLVQQYTSLLKVNRSVVLRHLIAIAFRFYTEDVFRWDHASERSEPLQTYVDRFQTEIEARLEYAREELEMDV